MDLVLKDLNSSSLEKIINKLPESEHAPYLLKLQSAGSQLMTQDFFEMMGHVMQTNATQEEANASIDFFERWAGKTGSKHIPLATFWRWSNKVMAEGEAQLIKWQDHFLKSSPYAFLQWANEIYYYRHFCNDYIFIDADKRNCVSGLCVVFIASQNECCWNYYMQIEIV